MSDLPVKTKKTKTGFDRLKGLAAAAVMATGASAIPLTARAAVTSNSRHSFSIVYGTLSGSTSHAARWVDVGNQPTVVSGTNTFYVYSQQFTSTSTWTYTTTWTTGGFSTCSTIFTPSTFTTCWWSTGSIFTSTTTSTSTYTTTTTSTTSQYQGPTNLITSFTTMGTSTVPPEFAIGGVEYFKSGSNSISDASILDGMLGFSVDGNMFYSPAGQVDLNAPGEANRIVSSGTLTDIVEGIDAQVELFFSGELPYVRALYTLTNTTGTTTEVSLAVRGKLAYGLDTTLQASSDEDALLEDSDTWFVVNDSQVLGQEGEGSPAVFITRFGAGAAVQPSNEAGIESGSLSQVYDITVPRNSSRRVMVFLALSPSIDEAREMATTMEGNLNADAFLAGLSLSELSEIVNYDFGIDDPAVTEPLTEEVIAKKKDDGLFGSLDYGILLGGLAGLLFRRRQQQ